MPPDHPDHPGTPGDRTDGSDRAEGPPPPDGSAASDRHDPAPGADGKRSFAEAAIEAERSSGHREETVEQVKRHLAVRVAIIAAGSFVLLLGLALLALPGPGLVVVALGLALLATEIPFAARLLDRVKRRLPQDADGKLPRSAVAMMVATCTVAMGLSLWWTFLR